MAKVPFDQNHKLHRLLFVTVIVGANQGEAIAKILKDNEAYFCFFMHGKGTAPGSALEMLGLSDNRKSIVASVVKEDRWPLVRSALESRFSVSSLAKGLAYAANKPLVPVHHLRGHIAALYLTHPELKPPFLCLVASGGHSHIVQVEDYTRFRVLGRTVDDAAGEAFDKVARTLGLAYPGGPSIAAAAKTGDPHAYRLPVPHVEGKYNVSFSGLKTAVLNEVNQANMKGLPVNVPDLAASFQERIDGILAEKLLAAAADTGARQVCLAGGVAANGRLRQLVNDRAQKLGAQVFLPQLKFCGDNGAMIASQGYYEFAAGHTAGLDLNGLPTLPIDYQ